MKNYDMQPIIEIMDGAIIKLNKIMETTQKKEIRKYLEYGGKLTAMAALNFWGCWNLKGRIWDINQDYFEEWFRSGKSLRKLGIKEIDKNWVKTESGKRVAEYYLI